MATSTEVFNYAYSLAKNGPGDFKLVDANPASPGTQTVAIGVTVVDTDGGQIEHGDKFKVSNIASGSMSSTGGKYTFVGTASLGGGDGIVVKDSNGNFYYLTDKAYSGNLNSNHGTLTNFVNDVPTAFCFMAGTAIATASGAVAVEDLAIGDMVLNSDGKSVPVRWIGRQAVSRLFADELRLPIRIKASALADNVPSRDLLVSPEHALFIDDVLVQAGALVNGVSVVREGNVPATFTYYHIELDDHALVLAENVPAETFVDNVDRFAFDNWDEYLSLYPEGKNVEEMSYPRAKAYRQVPKALRQRLEARGVALFGAAEVNAA